MLLNTNEKVTVTNKGIISLGKEVMISDPCYGLGTWCQGVLTNVLPGEYECFVEHSDEDEFGSRVARIYVKHKDYLDALPYGNLEDIEVGVDSGTAGIYDNDYYKMYHSDKSEKEHVDENWYDRTGDLTYVLVKNPNYKELDVDDPDFLTKYKEYMQDPYSHFEYIRKFDANTIDGKGFVSSAGYGDGIYRCYTTRNADNQIVSIMIEFISEYDDEEEE